jgi:type IV secretory pathway VirJ component
MRRISSQAALVVVLALAAVGLRAAPTQDEAKASVTMRGKTIGVRTFGARGKPPVVVSSGDGGWVHLGPHVATVLASRGYFVVGFDSKGYLSKFTSDTAKLSSSDVQADYRTLAEFATAASGSSELPILVGVSEGAALSVLAAARDDARTKIRGVIAVGLPDLAELAWRWRDVAIYFTHKVPNEPTFNVADVIAGVSPIPLAAIQSSHDEFVPLETFTALLARAREPKRVWLIDASDHAFGNKLPEFDSRLSEAVAWIAAGGK